MNPASGQDLSVSLVVEDEFDRVTLPDGLDPNSAKLF